MSAGLTCGRRAAWRASRRLRYGAPAVLLAAVAAITAAGGQGVSAAAADGPDCPGQSPHNTPISASDFALVNGIVPRPVVLVHGWDSGYTAMRGYASLLDTSKVLHQPLHAFLFDYSANSGHWAAKPAIASCLADYVNAVSAAYRQAGGDGKVLAVGHSMGGLAIRFSASGQYAANPDGANLDGVITIDTPHLGSPWGNTPDGQLGQDWTQFNNGNGLEGFLPWPPGSDGQVCLATHHGTSGMPAGCATPTWLPAGVPVAQVAGDIIVHRQLFGFDVADSDIKGDAVVSTASSLGYLPDSGPGAPPKDTAAPTDYVDTCEVTSGQLEAGVGGLGVSVLNSLESALEYVGTLGDRPLSSSFSTLLTLADLKAPCGHTHINNPATDPFASLDVLKALNADLDRASAGVAPPPGSVAALTPSADFSATSGIVKADGAYWFAAATESPAAHVTTTVYRWDGRSWRPQAVVPIINKDGSLASGGLMRSAPITVQPLTGAATPDFLIHSFGADTFWLNVVSDATGQWAVVPFDDSGGQTFGENEIGISGTTITIGYDNCLPDCATGHVTTVSFRYSNGAFMPVDPPGSCTGEALAQSAHASAPNAAGESDAITGFACAGGYAAATATNGNYGWVVTFKSTGNGWTYLGSGNIMPSTGIPLGTYRTLNDQLRNLPQNEYYPY